MESFDAFWQIVTCLPFAKDGISPMDMLAMPQAVASLLRAINRSNGMSLAALAVELGFDSMQAGQVSRLLVERGYLLACRSEADDSPVYRVHLARTQQRNIPLEF